MSTGVRKESTQDLRIIKGMIENEKAFVESLSPFSSESSLKAPGGGTSTSGNGGTGPGNFLPLAGGTMLGRVGNQHVIITIASDSIDLSSAAGNDSPYVFLNPESGLDDNLVTIVPGSDILTNAELWIEIANKTITFKNTGNIVTPSGDFPAPTGTILKLIYSAGQAKWIIVSASNGLGGGFTEPQQFSVKDMGNMTGAQTLTPDTHNVFKGTLIADATVTISSTLPAGKFQIIHFQILQDATGGHNITSWTGVNGTPAIDTTPNASTTVSLFSLDGGATWTFVATKGGTIGGASTLSALTIDVDKDWNLKNITNIAGIDLNGVSATIQGVVNLDFFQASQSINSLAGSLSYQGAVLDKHSFILGGVEVSKFIESAAGVYRLDMLAHAIVDSKDIRFSKTGATVFPGTEPAVGYDSVASRLKVNYPTGASVFVTENDTIGSTQLKSNSIDSNIINANDSMQLGVDPTVPSVAGEFRSDGTDVFVFSGASVRNLSNIGIAAGGADVFLSNLATPTSINQSLIPQAGKKLGDSGNPWSELTSNKITVGTAGTLLASDNAIIANAATGLKYNAAITQLHEFRLNDEVMAQISRISASKGDLLMFSLSPSQILMQDTAADPTVDGQFTRNGTRVKVKTNGVVKDLSDIGTGSATNQIIQGDSSVTVTDVGTGSIVAKVDNVQKLNISPTSINFDDSVVLGVLGSDDITFNGKLASTIGIKSDGLYSVGDATHRLVDIYSSGLKLNSSIGVLLSSGGITHNIALGDNHIFNVNSVSKMQISETIIDLKDDVILGVTSSDNLTFNGNANSDLKFNFGKYVDYNESQSSVGSAGLATVLPSQPEGYVIVKIAGIKRVIPFYKQV